MPGPIQSVRLPFAGGSEVEGRYWRTCSVAEETLLHNSRSTLATAATDNRTAEVSPPEWGYRRGEKASLLQ